MGVKLGFSSSGKNTVSRHYSIEHRRETNSMVETDNDETFHNV